MLLNKGRFMLLNKVICSFRKLKILLFTANLVYSFYQIKFG